MKKNKPSKTVFVDLDSTLCDTSPRHHLILDDRSKMDWEAYAMACGDDKPVEGVIRLVQMLARTRMFLIVILSGRMEKADKLTREWLQRFDVPYHDLILRPPDLEHLTNEQFKVQMMLQWLLEHPWTEPELVIDDWPPVAEKMLELGIPCLIVNLVSDEDIERKLSLGLR